MGDEDYSDEEILQLVNGNLNTLKNGKAIWRDYDIDLNIYDTIQEIFEKRHLILTGVDVSNEGGQMSPVTQKNIMKALVENSNIEETVNSLIKGANNVTKQE